MTDTALRPLSAGPSTYLDSTDATTDHSSRDVAPMLKDQTALYVGLNFGSPDLDATFDGDVIVTAATDFDGTVTLSLLPILDNWDPAMAYAAAPDVWTDTAATFTGTIAAGQTVSFDVSAFGTTYAAGSQDAAGFRIIRTDTGTSGSLFTSRVGDERAPTLLGDWISSPDTPTGLVPNGNLIVGAAKPIVKADAPTVPMVKQQWQIGSSSAGFTAAAGLSGASFDSGELDATVLQLDLSTTAFAGFPAAGTTRYLTCRYKGADGSWSDYAPPVQVGGWQALPAPVFTLPSFGICGSVNPAYEWTPDGTQTKFQIVTSLTDTTASIDDSGEVAGTATAYQTAPKPLAGTGSEPGVLLKGTESVGATLRQWDDVDRIATPGLPIYGSTSITFQFADNGTVSPVDDVSALQVGASPWPMIQFSDSSSNAADHYIFMWGANTDSTLHIARVKPANLILVGDSEGTKTYAYYYWGAQPRQSGYVAGVKREVGGQTSDAVFGALDSLDYSGMWFVDADPTSKTYLIMAQHTGVGSTHSRTDQIGILQGLGAQFPSFQWSTESYIAGDCQGVIRDFDGVSASDWQKFFRRLAGSGRVLQIAYDDTSYPGVIFNYAADELDGSGDPFVKQIRHQSVQLDLASYTDEPPNFGSPVITTYDFETDIDGNPTVDGDPILKASVDGGAPGVIDKDGQPEYARSAAQHGIMGADTGWGS